MFFVHSDFLENFNIIVKPYSVTGGNKENKFIPYLNKV